MTLLFGEIRNIVAPFAGRAGKAASSDEVADFARDCMQLMLYSGAYAGVRTVRVQACRGCVVLPPEVETPLKLRVDQRSAEIWNRWYSFHSADDTWDRCDPIGSLLIEDGTMSPLVYPLPEKGSVIGLTAVCEETSFVTIQGNDVTGREVYTYYKGEKIVGEKFQLQKGTCKYGQVKFGTVTGAVKERTNGYVACFAIDTVTKKRQFLADWSPHEERPLYKQYRLRTTDHGGVANLSILCRVKLKDSYQDNELTLFDNRTAVLLAAQRLRAETNSDNNNAQYKKGALDQIQNEEAGVKSKSGGPLDVCNILSGCAVKNLY